MPPYFKDAPVSSVKVSPYPPPAPPKNRSPCALMEEIRADISELERETDGLLEEIVTKMHIYSEN